MTTTPTQPSQAPVASLHPDCPDVRRLGPTPQDGALRALADRVDLDAQAHQETWGRRSWTRRRVLAGGLGVGAAVLGSQMVTTRVSYAADATSTGTLVVVTLRGGQDGLSMLVPAEDRYLLAARPDLAIRERSLIALDRGFGLHSRMSALRPLINAGKLAAIPAVSTPDLSRSHFQAMDCLERGGAEGSAAQAGWLDRVLDYAGTGTTFRSVAFTSTMPRSMSGGNDSVAMRRLADMALVGPTAIAGPSQEALRRLYTGLDHPFAAQAMLALEAAQASSRLAAVEKSQGGRGYPAGEFGDALRNVATLIREGTGIRVACVDVGGWDTHTQQGVDDGDLPGHLGDLASGLAAFAADLGSKLDDTTVVTMTEFGRRVEQNASRGTDHGHGSAVLVLGGGVRGGVHGQWDGLAPEALADGDVAGSNDWRDVLSELITTRVGLSSSEASSVFGGWSGKKIGFMA